MLSADLAGPLHINGVVHTAVHRRPALYRITSDAIYYHTDFIYFLTLCSQLFSITQDLHSSAEELYSNQMTTHHKKKN